METSVIDEILRARHPIRPEVFRRWQRELQTLRDEMVPLIQKAESAFKPKGKKDA